MIGKWFGWIFTFTIDLILDYLIVSHVFTSGRFQLSISISILEFMMRNDIYSYELFSPFVPF